MADIEAEIARLQAEIEKRRYEVESLRQEQPVWDDDAAADGSEYSEESYYEEEIIEEYSDDEWEEEIIEEEIIEEEVIEVEEDEEEEVVQNVAPTNSTPVVSNNVQPIPCYRVAQPPSENKISVPAIASSPPATVAAPAPLTTPRKWTPSYARTTPAAPDPVKIEPAPAAPKWKRPTQVTPPPPPPPQQSSSVPAWATKQQSKIKKTAVPIITSANSAPAPEKESTPVIRAPPAPVAPAAGPPVTRTKAKVRPPPGANGQAVVKNAPPPGLETDAKLKGPRIKIINWGANRRTNTAIQSETRPNFKPNVPGTTTSAEPEKVKRNYIIPKDVKKTVGPDGTTTAAPTSGHKRRPIPDLPVSPPGEETLWEQLLGPKLIANSKLQKKNTTGCMKDQELIGLYFGCKMKPECKYFHPRLQDFYFSAAARQQNFEIVYVSSDRTLNDFKELFAKMPYFALPGGTAWYKNKLSQSLKIIDQPTLVILDDEGMVVTVDAVQQILQLEKNNIEQANALIDRWKRTRPVTMEQIQRDFTLQDGKQQRGILYWQE